MRLKYICTIVIVANIVSLICNAIDKSWQLAIDNLVVAGSWFLISILDKINDKKYKERYIAGYKDCKTSVLSWLSERISNYSEAPKVYAARLVETRQIHRVLGKTLFDIINDLKSQEKTSKTTSKHE